MGIALNFGLVHEPPSYDYEFSFNDLAPELLETLPENFEEILNSFTDEELLVLRWKMNWRRIARKKQLPHPDFLSMKCPQMVVNSGRGFGKTLMAANWLGLEAADIPGYYIVVAPTYPDVRYTCFEGPTGLLAVMPPQLIVDVNKSLPSITMWNGSIIRGFSGDAPERLRGPQCNSAWCDEIASWKSPQDAWDNMNFGLRLGETPRIMVTGTPKPTPFMKRLRDDPKSCVVVASTYDNRANLTDHFFENVGKYEGTKVGRQELHGELLDAEEFGFVKRSQWRRWPANKPLPRFSHIVMSVDPAYSDKQHNKKKQESDPSACSVWGLFSLKSKGKTLQQIMLLNCWEDWLTFPDLIDTLKKEFRLTYGDADEPLIKPREGPRIQRVRHQGRKPDTLLIETKASGTSLIQQLAVENILAEGYNPGLDDKLTRLHLSSPPFAHGRIWCPESRKNPGQFASWADPLITQVCSFVGEGSIERDDLLDSATQAIRLLVAKYFAPFTVASNPGEDARKAALANERRRGKSNAYDG